MGYHDFLFEKTVFLINLPKNSILCGVFYTILHIEVKFSEGPWFSALRTKIN